MPSTNVWKRQKEEGKIMKDNWDEQITEDQSDGMLLFKGDSSIRGILLSLSMILK